MTESPTDAFTKSREPKGIALRLYRDILALAQLTNPHTQIWLDHLEPDGGFQVVTTTDETDPVIKGAKDLIIVTYRGASSQGARTRFEKTGQFESAELDGGMWELFDSRDTSHRQQPDLWLLVKPGGTWEGVKTVRTARDYTVGERTRLSDPYLIELIDHSVSLGAMPQDIRNIFPSYDAFMRALTGSEERLEPGVVTDPEGGLSVFGGYEQERTKLREWVNSLTDTFGSQAPLL